MDLAVRETGTGETLVVLVHGVIDRGSTFDGVVEVLADEYRMITYDRRGYGASVTDRPADVDEHARDLLAILDGRRAVVVAHSFGGLVAAGAAIAAPELVASVAFYESVFVWAPGWADRLVPVLAADDPEAAALRLVLGDRVDSLSPSQLERRRQAARAMVAEERAARARVPLYDLAELRMPVLYGSPPPPRMQPVVDYLTACRPDAEVMEFPQDDHFLQRNDPEAFADFVRRAVALGA